MASKLTFSEICRNTAESQKGKRNDYASIDKIMGTSTKVAKAQNGVEVRILKRNKKGGVVMICCLLHHVAARSPRGVLFITVAYRTYHHLSILILGYRDSKSKYVLTHWVECELK